MKPKLLDLGGLRHFGFLVLPGYSLIAVTSAVEALRMANRCAEDRVYRWTLYGLDEHPVTASNGLTLGPTLPLGAASAPDLLFVCGGIDVRASITRPLLMALRRCARAGTPLGALCTGAVPLAAAGLLDGYRCAVHWEDMAAIRTEFPDIDFANELFVLDRDRLTCTGGTGPLDMMLHLIESGLSRTIAEHVRASFVLDRIRAGTERQPLTRDDRLDLAQPMLARAVTLIEAKLGEKQPLGEIAAALGISMRQLQRLFRAQVGQSPATFIKALRLKRAQTMLQTMKLPVTSIAMACGFGSSTYFASAYRQQFGRSPTAEREERVH